MPSVEWDELAGQAPAEREVAEQRAGGQLDHDLLPGPKAQVAAATNRREVVDEAKGPAQHKRDQYEAARQRAVGRKIQHKRHQNEDDAAGGWRPGLAVVRDRAFFTDLLTHPRPGQLPDRRREDERAQDQRRDKDQQRRHRASRICSTTRSSRIPREPLTSTCVWAVSSGVTAATAASALSTT